MNQTSAYKLQNEVLLSGIKKEFGTSTIELALFNSTEEILTLIGYYENRMLSCTKEQKQVFKVEINRLETLLSRKIEINCDIYGINSNTMSAVSDAIGFKEDTTISEVLPDKTEKPETKVVGLLHGEKLAEKPTLKDLRRACETLIKKNQKDAAIDLASKYLSEGKYTPNEGKKVHNWPDKNIQNWLKDIDEKIAEEATPDKAFEKKPEAKKPETKVEKPKEEVATEEKQDEVVEKAVKGRLGDKAEALDILGDINPNQIIPVVDLDSYYTSRTLRDAIKKYDVRIAEKMPKITEEQEETFKLLHKLQPGTMTPHMVSPMSRIDALVNYGSPEITLAGEITKFKYISTLVHNLYNNVNVEGLSDEEAKVKKEASIKEADIITKAFFKYRGYTEEQINAWKEKVTNSEATPAQDFELDLMMSVPGLLSSEELKEYDKSYDDLYTEIHNMYLEGIHYDKVVDQYEKILFGKTIKNEDGLSMNMYTPLHARDFASKLYYEARRNVSTISEDNLINVLTSAIKEHKTLSAIKDDHTVKSVLYNRYALPNEPLVQITEGEHVKPVLNTIEKEGKTLYFTKEGLDNYISALYNALISKFRAGIKGDYKDQITYDTFEKYLKENIDMNINDLMMTDFIKDVANKGYLISNSKNFTLCWVVESFKSTKELREFIEGYIIKNKQKAQGSERAVEIKAMSLDQLIPEKSTDIFPMGRELIQRFGYTEEQIDAWSKEHLLNVQLTGSNPGSEFKDEAKLKAFVSNMFQKFFREGSEESGTKLEKMELTPEVERIVTEKTGLIPMVKRVRSYFSENGLRVGLKDALDFTKSVVAKLNPSILEQQEKDKVDSKIETVKDEKVEEPVIEAEIFDGPTDLEKEMPDVWAKVKSFTKLDEVYNFIRELNESGDWKTSLSVAIILIANNNQIEDAKGWNEEQVTTWFNTTFTGKQLGPELEETKEDPKSGEEKSAPKESDTVSKDKPQETVENVPSESVTTGKEEKSKSVNTESIDFSPVTTALNKTSYVEGIRKILEKHGTKNEIRTQIVDAIRNQSTGKQAKRMSKNRPEDLFNSVNKQAKLIEDAKSSK